MTTYNCLTCGACCFNTDLNRRYGHMHYLEIDDGDAILDQPELVRRLVVLDGPRGPHMRLTERQCCAALEGDLGREVRCTVYEVRPTGCRLLEPGTEDCLRARRERGVDDPAPLGQAARLTSPDQ